MKEEANNIEKPTSSSIFISSSKDYKEEISEEENVEPIEKTKEEIVSPDLENGNNFLLNFDANDPGTWPKEMSIKVRDCLIENVPKQIVLKFFF